MAVKVNQYKVMYKLPRQKQVVMDYTAATLAALMRNLQISEGVNKDTAEIIVVHQIMENGAIVELVDHDILKNPQPGINVVDIKSVRKPVITGDYSDDDDDELLGYKHDVHVLDKVILLLTKASTSTASKPRIKYKTEPVKKKKTPGFHFSAKPAIPSESRT